MVFRRFLKIIFARRLDLTTAIAPFRLHAWGETLEEAFEQCAMAMFGYMTDLERVQITQAYHVEAIGYDLLSLLFHFLDELLFMFSAEPYIIPKVQFFS